MANGEMPSREEILAMTDRQLLAFLRELGIEPDVASMREAADAAFSRVGIAMENGQETIDAATWESIDKQVERAYTAALRREVKGAVRDARLSELINAAMASGLRTMELVWIATMVNTCPSCEERHGLTASYLVWKQRGLPGSAALICDGDCNCQLLPIMEGPEVIVEMEAYL